MNELVVTTAVLHQAWVHLRYDENRVVRRLISKSELDGRTTWLANSDPAPVHDPALVIGASARPEALLRRLVESAQSAHAGHSEVLMVMGTGESSGVIACLGQSATPFKLTKITIVGPHMATVRGKELPLTTSSKDETFSLEAEKRVAHSSRKLVNMRFAIVGLGRRGEMAATALRRLGVANLDLIDPARLAEQNLNQFGYADGNVGDPKPASLARYLNRLPCIGGSFVRAIEEPAESPFCAPIMKSADMLISCDDTPRTRLAICLMGAALLKPVLDISTGRIAEGGESVTVANIRLTLPGRCLWCMGGIPGIELGRGVGTPGSDRTEVMNWRYTNREGLDSLSMTAVGLAMHVVEDLVAGRLNSDNWLRLEFAPDGTPVIARQVARYTNKCPVCRRTGTGDLGLRDLDRVHQEILTSRIPRIF